MEERSTEYNTYVIGAVQLHFLGCLLGIAEVLLVISRDITKWDLGYYFYFGCDALFRWRKAGWIHHHPFLPRAGLRPAKSRLAARDYNQNSITFGLTNGYNVCITFHFKWEKVQITIVQTYYWLGEKKKFSWIFLSSDIFCQIHLTPLASLWDLANFCRSCASLSTLQQKGKCPMFEVL